MKHFGLISVPVVALALVLGVGTASDVDPHVSRSTESGKRTPTFIRGIKHHRIPFGSKRKRQMAAYSRHHYGRADWRLRSVEQVVLHSAEGPTVASVFNTFAGNQPLLGERPGVCSHFVIGAGGATVQMVSLRIRCRHVIGLNHLTVGIEHVGYGSAGVFHHRRQLRASLKLVRRLRCLFDIPVRDVIGHAESLRSRFHRERVGYLKHATSPDFPRRAMRIYRSKLSKMEPCPDPPAG